MSRRVSASEIFLPVWKLQEELTHLDCPGCASGEIALGTNEVHVCDSCGAVFELQLEQIGSVSNPATADS
jgi:hypothetical protein